VDGNLLRVCAFQVLNRRKYMQLVNTHVANVHEGAITVEFRGEVNELVSVCMATDGSVDEESAVRRAKALMVQIATFGDGGGAGASEIDGAPPIIETEDQPAVHALPVTGEARVVDIPRD